MSNKKYDIINVLVLIVSFRYLLKYFYLYLFKVIT